MLKEMVELTEFAEWRQKSCFKDGSSTSRVGGESEAATLRGFVLVFTLNSTQGGESLVHLTGVVMAPLLRNLGEVSSSHMYTNMCNCLRCRLEMCSINPSPISLIPVGICVAQAVFLVSAGSWRQSWKSNTVYARTCVWTVQMWEMTFAKCFPFFFQAKATSPKELPDVLVPDLS